MRRVYCVQVDCCARLGVGEFQWRSPEAESEWPESAMHFELPGAESEELLARLAECDCVISARLPTARNTCEQQRRSGSTTIADCAIDEL